MAVADRTRNSVFLPVLAAISGLLPGPRLEDGQDALHLVADDHEAFVEAHARLGQQALGPGGHGGVDAGAGRDLGLVAGAALVGLHAVAAAIEDGLDRVLDAAETGRLDLALVAAPR